MKFVFSGNLLRFSGFRREVEIQASTVGQGLSELVTHCPALAPVLLDGQGQLRAVHRLFLNGEQLTGPELERAAQPDDEVTLLTAIAGG
jgi:molybdopterin synthase sulfur carrier subunit